MSDRDERELLAFADEIARYARPVAPAGLRSQLRASLLGAPVAPVRAPTMWMRFPGIRPVAAALVVVAMLLGSGGYAAAGSLPGDPAFALKRAVEETQVALTADDAARLDARVTQSDRRVSDLHQVAASRPAALDTASAEYLAAVARVEQAIATVLSLPATAGRSAALARAAQAGTDHIALLRSLATRLPAQALPGIQRAIEAQEAMHGRSGDAPGRPSVPRPGGAPLPSTVPGGRPSAIPVPSGRGVPPGRP